jgi:hypothetical protein
MLLSLARSLDRRWDELEAQTGLGAPESGKNAPFEPCIPVRRATAGALVALLLDSIGQYFFGSCKAHLFRYFNVILWSSYHAPLSRFDTADSVKGAAPGTHKYDLSTPISLDSLH